MCLSVYPINRVLYISGAAGIPTSAGSSKNRESSCARIEIPLTNKVRRKTNKCTFLILQDLCDTPQELYRQAIATRNPFHIWPPWGIAFLQVCVTSRHVKVCLTEALKLSWSLAASQCHFIRSCLSTPQAWGGSPCLCVMFGMLLQSQPGLVKGRTMVTWMIIHDHPTQSVSNDHGYYLASAGFFQIPKSPHFRISCAKRKHHSARLPGVTTYFVAENHPGRRLAATAEDGDVRCATFAWLGGSDCEIQTNEFSNRKL